MKCAYCRNAVPMVIHMRRYTHEGIPVCPQCYDLVNAKWRQPYSTVMDKFAMLEAGYLVNRKIAAGR